MEYNPFSVSIVDAVKSIDEFKELSSEDPEIVAQLYANYIEFEILSGHAESAVDIATRSVNELPTSSTVSASMSSAVSLMVIHTINRNLDLLQPEVVSKLDHLVMLKTDECVFEYAKYLLKTVIYQWKPLFLQLLISIIPYFNHIILVFARAVQQRPIVRYSAIS